MENNKDKSKGLLKKSFSDAKKVVVRGNMLMLAIGLLLGAAFGAVVSSLANDVIVKAIYSAFGSNQSIDKWQWNGILIGKFLAAVIYFVIVSLSILIGLTLFYFIGNLRRVRREKLNPPSPASTPAPTTEELILAELKKLNNHHTK